MTQTITPHDLCTGDIFALTTAPTQQFKMANLTGTSMPQYPDITAISIDGPSKTTNIHVHPEGKPILLIQKANP